MSYFDDASLVMIPSGYKTSKVYSVKPTSGDGDLTFTRSNDTATRVGPDGLIEKVRTNLIPQSNTFSNATWSKVNSTVTSGQSGYDATFNAWLLTDDAIVGAHSVTQFTRWATTLQTGSVYVKAGTNTKAYIGNATTNRGAFFNLSTGTLEGTIGTVVSQSIVSVGSGWYRISVTLEGAGTFIIGSYQTFVSGNFPLSIAYSGSGSNILIQNTQLEAGDIATQPILTTTAAVSVGPVANVPRLDYLNSSCPRLLLEPQTTAVTTYSEQIDNAAWGKQNVSVTANNTASPSGYVDADKIVEDTANSMHVVSNNFTASTATSHTFSVFAKMGERKYLCFAGSNVGAFSATYDLEAGTVVGVTGATASIEDYGNGWYRCVAVKVIASAGGVAVRIGTGTTATVASSGLTQSYLGDGTSGLFIWGVNVTATAYPQSYIPTLGAAVTRGADACSKTGISSLIGQTEGTLFAEVEFNTNSTDLINRIFSVTDGTITSRILICSNTDETFRFIVSVAATTVVNITTSKSVFGGRHKVAFAYKANDFIAYVDGVQVGSNTAVSSLPASLTAAYVGTVEGGASAQILEGTVSQALLFKTRLTNAQLAELTTI